MSEIIIKGLNVKQYALFNFEAATLRRRWEKSGRQEDIENEMLSVFAKYNQSPADCMEEGKLNYYLCGQIPEWDDLVSEDPKITVEFSMIQNEHNAKQMYGDGQQSAEISIEGVTLENYAKICASIQGKTEEEMSQVIVGMGLKDMDHWQRVGQGFTQAMGKDMKLAVHFGQLFAQYGQGHMENIKQQTIDSLSEQMEEEDEQEEKMNAATEKLAEMAMSSQGGEIFNYLKANFSEEDEDNDSLDWHLGRALDLLVDAQNKEGAKVLLGVRYDYLMESDDKEGSNREEWIEEELESLFF